MEKARHPESTADPEPPGYAEEPFTPVKLIILTRVDDVEAGSPERHCRRQPKDTGIEGTPNRDPRRRRCDPQAQSEHHVGERSESLREGIEEYNSEREWRKLQTQRIQRRCGGKEHKRCHRDKGPR